MKKTVRVTIEKEFEIEIKDALLTEDAVEEFQQFFWKIEGVDDLFKYAAEQVASYESHFIEGLGEAESIFSSRPSNVTFKEIYDDCESEIIEE